MDSANNREIIFIEDDGNDIFIIRRALAAVRLASAIRPTFARDFDEAQALLLSRILTRRLPWLIVTDVKLPGHTGFEIVHWIRHKRELCTVPLWILTSSQIEADRLEARRLRAQHFLVKPASTDELTTLFQERLKALELSTLEG